MALSDWINSIKETVTGVKDIQSLTSGGSSAPAPTPAQAASPIYITAPTNTAPTPGGFFSDTKNIIMVAAGFVAFIVLVVVLRRGN